MINYKEETAARAAIMLAYSKGKRIQARGPGNTNWENVMEPSWCWLTIDYRVDPTDVDMVKAPLDRSYFEGRPVWVRVSQPSMPNRNCVTLLVAVSDTEVQSLHSGTVGKSTYAEMMNGNYEYSYDCKTWLPCHKLVPAS